MGRGLGDEDGRGGGVRAARFVMEALWIIWQLPGPKEKNRGLRLCP